MKKLTLITIAFLSLGMINNYNSNHDHLDTVKFSYIGENHITQNVAINYLTTLTGPPSCGGRMIWLKLWEANIDSSNYLERHIADIKTGNRKRLRNIQIIFDYTSKDHRSKMSKLTVDGTIYSIENYDFDKLLNDVIIQRALEYFQKHRTK